MDKQGINPNDQEHIDLFLENPDNRELYYLAQFSKEETEFDEHGFLILEEYEGIPHVVTILANPNHDSLKASYLKAAEKLELAKVDEVGVTILLGIDWMMVIPLTDPVSERGDIPHFIDPLSYVGIININFENKFWPQTAKIDEDKSTPLKILQRASRSFISLKEEKQRQFEEAKREEDLKNQESEDES